MGARSEVNNLEWQKTARCKLAIVWCRCAKNRISIRCLVKATPSAPTLTRYITDSFCLLLWACPLLLLGCFHLLAFNFCFPSELLLVVITSGVSIILASVNQDSVQSEVPFKSYLNLYIQNVCSVQQ